MQAELLIFTGNANPALARSVCSYLDIPLGPALISRFNDGETRVEISTNVRGRDVFVLQPTCSPANEHIMELLIMTDALRRASAHRITAVIPYYGYGRQERKSAPRTPITAKLTATLLESAGVDRVLTLDLHTGAIQGFFNVPVDHLFAKPVICECLKNMDIDNPIMVSPDAGGTERARSYAKLLDCGLAIVDKRRDVPGVSSVMNVIGDVTDKTAILVDDICDTAGTFVQAAQALKDKGASRVIGAITHGVLSGPALERIEKSCIEKLIVTDTIPHRKEILACAKIQVVTVAELLGKAIRRIHNSDSVSSLFVHGESRGG